MIHLDYETYSEADLPNVGVWAYAEHPSTEVLCFAYAFDNEAPCIWYPRMPPPRQLMRRIREGETVCAWNANFERAITELVVTKALPDFPTPKLSQWNDIQAIAAMLALPLGLGMCAHVLELSEQKNEVGKDMLRIFSWPGKNGRTTPTDDPKNFQKLVRYCIQDVRTERALLAEFPVKELPAFEKKVWVVDSKINKRGVQLDHAMARGGVAINDQLRAREVTRLPKLTGGKVTTPKQHQKLKAWLTTQGVDIPNSQKETIAKAMERGDLPPRVRKVLRIVQLLGPATIAKYVAALHSSRDGRARAIHQYGAAHTLRWGGRRIQFQNAARPTRNVQDDLDLIRMGDLRAVDLFYDDPMQLLRDAVRHLVIAAPGKTLNVSDLSSIEARVLGWLAEEPTYMEAFLKGRDLYIVMASSIFGIKYEQIEKDLKSANDDVRMRAALLRFLGKETVLALGYSMGEPKFQLNVKTKSKTPIDRKLITKAHALYRATCKRIVAYWYDVERAATGCIKLDKKMRVGRVTFEMIDGYLTIGLPSGRSLWYPEAKLVMGKTSWGESKVMVSFMTYVEKGKQWLRVGTYGGRLAENIVQAIARDVLAHDLLELDRLKHPVVMHVHDEILSETKKNRLEELVGVMSKSIPWAPGLPLGAKGFCSTIYRKD